MSETSPSPKALRASDAVPRPELNPRWSAGARHIIDRFARAIVRGRYPLVKAALPDCWRELQKKGYSTGRSQGAVRFQLSDRARALGRVPRHRPWSPRELAILDRYARAVALGKYENAEKARIACLREFSRVGVTLRHSPRALGDKLRRRAREMGRAPAVSHWDAAERRVIERFARAVIRGEYPNTPAAGRDCLDALRRIQPTTRRTQDSTALRIRRRAHALGWRPLAPDWTAAELRVVDRFARAIVAGRFPTAPAALAACRDALGRVTRPEPRVDAVILDRLTRRARACGRPAQLHRWSPAEEDIVRRYAEAAMQGKYPSLRAAVPDCRQALGRAGLPARHLDSELYFRLARYTRRAGWGPKPVPWRSGQTGIASRFARLVLAGRYASVTEAARDCAVALERWGRRNPGQQTSHPLTSVTIKLWQLVAASGLPHAEGIWKPAEIAVIDRYVRAVVAHRYRTLHRAVPDCWRAVNRTDRRKLRSELEGVGRPTTRSQLTVHTKMVERARVIARYRISHRHWHPVELKQAVQWVRRYDRYRRGRLRANLSTLAGMMRDQLDRLGFYRTQSACRGKILELYHGIIRRRPYHETDKRNPTREVRRMKDEVERRRDKGERRRMKLRAMNDER